jgi:orotidine-5'-phosphate decarboxylase
MVGVDCLISSISERGNPSVIGLDPTPEMIPRALSRDIYDAHGHTPRAVSEMFLLYNKALIDELADIVPAVKPQIAMYERYGADGIAAYISTCEYAASRGLFVIGDVKRGDIASTAEAYAAHLTGTDGTDIWHEDAITINPYFGTDGIEPFTRACAAADKMIFVLVKTSNPGSAELQDLTAGPCEPGGTPIKLYERVAGLVDTWGEDLLGESGYSSVGAVVGATHPDVGRALREAHPHTFFLVPGYGAQGAGADDIRGFFDKEGRGCIVNSSRGVIAAWQRDAAATEAVNSANDAGQAARAAARAARTAAHKMAQDIRAVIPLSQVDRSALVKKELV